mgnify:CR=1 FL=1
MKPDPLSSVSSSEEALFLHLRIPYNDETSDAHLKPLRGFKIVYSYIVSLIREK